MIRDSFFMGVHQGSFVQGIRLRLIPWSVSRIVEVPTARNQTSPLASGLQWKPFVSPPTDARGCRVSATTLPTDRWDYPPQGEP
ncbi:hypothetical protein ACFLYO_09010 [Chloroflexota bacterium]